MFMERIVMQSAHDRYLEQLAGNDVDDEKSLEELISEAENQDDYDNQSDK